MSSEKLNLTFDSDENEKKNTITHCYCNECDTTHKIEDCELAVDSEGWEYPDYYYHKCPVCMKHESVGDITDYFTDEDMKTFEKDK